jgi:hypothetical protein
MKWYIFVILILPIAFACASSYTLGRIYEQRFSMKKIRSAALIGLLSNKDMPRLYHTNDDTPENVDPAVMSQCLEICLQAIYDIDAKFS